MAATYMEYKRWRASRPGNPSFREYLAEIGFTDPSVGVVGMDDSAQFVRTPGGPELLAVPAQPVLGEVQVKVLLVDFPDRPGMLPREHYEDLLFSQGVYPTGSMRDYYKEVSCGKVDVVGTVDGWLRMPQLYSYYTNNQSGTRWDSYPRNAPRLAEDAVNVALAEGVRFDASLDKFSRGIITALFIVHAGRGAEVMQKPLQGGHIWSHKWNFRNPVEVAPNLAATIYLTVPFDCKVGVCAHELGHLAFQWQDFYDPNYAEDGTEWDGSGVWDLMAGGSYNGDGARPAHPAPLHKLQHGWITATTVKSSASLSIKPYTPTSGHVYKLVSSKFDQKQYLLLESRKRTGFDFALPGEGLLVWKVDEVQEQFAPAAPGLSLVQADGRNDLDSPGDWNQGDAGDPFPGSESNDTLRDSGAISTSFPGKRSGITLKKIRVDTNGVVSLDVDIKPSATPEAAAPAKRRVATPKVTKGGARKKGTALRDKTAPEGDAPVRKPRARPKASR
jgi:immune inhibitor A